MDLSFSVPPIEQFYTDFDGTLRCFDCALAYLDCVCVLSQTSSSYFSAFSNESSFYEPPTANEPTSDVDLSEVRHYLSDSNYLLVDHTVQCFNENGTVVQPATVQAHVDDTYLPGYRQLPASPGSQNIQHKRQPPRKNGFVCAFEGCHKAFDRNCELNRHLKIHLGRNERPHRCKFCAEGFLYPKDLTRHQRKHVEQASAKVTFHCQVYGCSNTEGFSRRDNLLRHHRRQHDGVASPLA
ncbi:uncharacterized protein EKO05_0010890 [Ascochyta rabiei]|uniref:Metal ion binding n=1 Tax=Didymella rabiei TaxID=5454 RepID=A0A162ZHX0_DIDRA|nr:uncharacterized protein EKO05_0010890 [Ascochyta rabiei]KZM20610.1 metal ion binding [Ascochyta rabiei]UPX20664.1 hypothetical protein EKO05_0010890 [Ascochyta rabiei]